MPLAGAKQKESARAESGTRRQQTADRDARGRTRFFSALV